jgi:hypothetical protein
MDFYQRAVRQGKAAATPHGAFRSLVTHDHAAAIGFLRKFGPLEEKNPHLLWEQERSGAA